MNRNSIDRVSRADHARILALANRAIFRWVAVATAAALLAALMALLVRPTGSPSATAPQQPDAKPSAAAAICGKRILNSPYSYHGAAGPYRSGTAGLPTFGTPGSDFPSDRAGAVLPTGAHDYASYQLKPRTVYYLLPGTHIGSIEADMGDAFVGGLFGGIHTVLTGNYSSGGQAIDSNSTDGNQAHVTIEYLTIEKFHPDPNAAAINQEANTGWNIRYNTIDLNVPGAGVIAGADNTLEYNCLTLNGQYGFQSTDTNGFGKDSLTGGPYNVAIKSNEISYNDTCDFSGLLTNHAIGWSGYNPVPPRYRNPQCGTIVPNGNQGGFKLWETNGVTIARNYIHNNWGPGAWVDTNNANTAFRHNVISSNEGPGIIEEISYNFSITGNYIASNAWTDGLGNSGFPTAAIYISESGSDTTFGGIPPCAEPSCSGQRSYPSRSTISRNTLVDNGGSIFLWQSANRYCGDGFDDGCPLVHDGRAGPFTASGCGANLASASVSTATYRGNTTGAPRANWWDGCLWRTENVSITSNIIDFNPAHIAYCNRAAWPDCGASGIFSDYSSNATYKSPGGWVIPTQLTFYQNNVWSHNTYHGPSTFYAWNQGNGDNPVSWANWTGSVSRGSKCSSYGQRQSGFCTGPFGQDAGSTYSPASG